MQRIVSFVLCLCMYCFTFAQKEPPVVTQVVENLYVIQGLGGNVAFLVSDDGVLVVDAGNSPNDGKTIIRLINEKTDKPIKYLVLTHYHGDHTNGMQAFPPEVMSIGQRNILSNLHERKEQNLKDEVEKRIPGNIERITKKIAELKSKNSPEVVQEEKNLSDAKTRLEEIKVIKIVDLVITFEKDTMLVLGSDTIDLVYPGPAHTKCNSVVYFRNQKVLHTGDLIFVDSFPYIIWQDGSNTLNWAAFLRLILRDWKIDKVIPGHGPVSGTEVLTKEADYLTELRSEVESAMKKGMTLEEIKKEITLPKYKDFKWPQLLGMNIEAVYYELGRK